MDIAEFLEARWAERAAVAKGAPGWKLEHWTAIKYASKDSGRNWRVDAEPRCVVDAVAAEDAEHIALNDPAAVLADIEAKRAILAEHRPSYPVTYPKPSGQPTCTTCHDGGFDWEPPAWPCRTVRLLIAPFAAHPDYDQTWRPEG